MTEQKAPYRTETEEAMEMLGKGYRIEGRPPTIFRTIHDPDNPYVMITARPSPTRNYPGRRRVS